MIQPPSPVNCLADLVVSVLERGIVLVLRLEGEPGNRRLAVGIGSAESAEALVLALVATGTFRHRELDPYYSWDE